jgi:hypothetical protein
MPAVDHRGVGLFEVDVVLRERVVVVHGRVVLGAVALRAGRRRPLARGLSRHAAPLRGSHSPRSGSRSTGCVAARVSALPAGRDRAVSAAPAARPAAALPVAGTALS